MPKKSGPGSSGPRRPPRKRASTKPTSLESAASHGETENLEESEASVDETEGLASDLEVSGEEAEIPAKAAKVSAEKSEIPVGETEVRDVMPSVGYAEGAQQKYQAPEKTAIQNAPEPELEVKISNSLDAKRHAGAGIATIREDTKMAQPFIVDLGSVKRSDVRRLKRGTGRKLDDALRAAQEAKAVAPDAVIVVLYRKKRRRSRSIFPFPFSLPS